MHKQKAKTTSRLQIERENDSRFWETIREYRKRSHQLVSHDPTSTERGKKRTDFADDVESASRCALQGTGLFYEWQLLAKDDIWPESRERLRIIRLCAPMYRERGLQPECYPTTSGAGSEKSAPRNVLRTPTRVLCKEHDVQTVMGRFKDIDGNIMKLECGCNRREDIAAAVPVKGNLVSISALPVAASISTRDGAPMSELLAKAA